MRTGVVALALAACLVGLHAQEPAESPAFEVASVRPSPPSQNTDCQPPTCYTGFYRTPPGRFIGTKLALSDLVAIAYEMPSNRLVIPDWTKSEHYDIDATHDYDATDRAALFAMLRHLLEERFSLRLHREQRPMDVYVLKRARDDGPLGPQLVSVTDCSEHPSFLPTWYSSCGGIGVPAATSRLGQGEWANLGLHRHLAPSVERPVIDETGLSGWFALRLDWSDGLPSATSPSVAPTDVDRPSLFTAMREQLGLMLEALERPMDVLVIDHVEPPTPN